MTTARTDTHCPYCSLQCGIRLSADPDGRLGLLVFVAQRRLSDAPVGNTFPTDAGLRDLPAGAGFAVRTSASSGRPTPIHTASVTRPAASAT